MKGELREQSGVKMQRFGCNVYRRNQCPELGWEWYTCVSGLDSEFEAQCESDIQIAIARRRSLIPSSRHNFKASVYKFEFGNTDAQTSAQHTDEMLTLAKLNKRHRVERVKAVMEGIDWFLPTQAERDEAARLMTPKEENQLC